MIEAYPDFSGLPLTEFPFTVLRPMELEFSSLTVRKYGEKWPTVRFVINKGGKEYRVKEFFMDWFFTGFPKSLLKDFSSSYSKILDFNIQGTDFFYGKNYHNRDSVSGYHRGTQIEIECNLPASIEEFMVIAGDLMRSYSRKERIEQMQFPERSYFSNGHESDWFEDQRVSRLKWLKTPQLEYTIPNHRMEASGIGYLNLGQYKHRILILQENGFQRNIWIESTSKGINLKNAFYDVRAGDGLYDQCIDKENEIILYRNSRGPGVLRAEVENTVFTIGFSPGFSLSDIFDFESRIILLENFIEDMLQGAIQENE